MHVGVAGAVPVPVDWVSFTPTEVNVRLPLFVTVKVSVITDPAADTVVGLADFAIVKPGVCVTGTEAVDGKEVN